jgi:hypothetical protein
VKNRFQNLPLKFNLHRYKVVPQAACRGPGGQGGAGGEAARSFERSRREEGRDTAKPQAELGAERRAVQGAAVGLYKLNVVDTQLESAWFQPLNLKSDLPGSSLCALKCNLYRYTAGGEGRGGGNHLQAVQGASRARHRRDQQRARVIRMGMER